MAIPMGSFGSLSPDQMEAIKHALDRRGMGDAVPALNTQSAAGPTPSPLPATPQGGTMPVPQISETDTMRAETPTPETLGGVGGASTPAPRQVGNPEAKMIIGALRERLKALSSAEMGGMT